jgi:hypothetical protein
MHCPDGYVYHYDIDISPEVPPLLNRRVFQALSNSNVLGGVRGVYDGKIAQP